MRTVYHYSDRREAGRVLADCLLERLGPFDDAVVLALPRGGIPVGLEIAAALGAPLEALVVRKLGAPGFEEFAIGAIAAGGFTVMNFEAIARLQLAEPEIAVIAAREEAELRRREALWGADRPRTSLTGRTAIVVDDGLATGFTMRAAIASAKARGPRRLAVAVPVGAPEACAAIARETDLLVCPLQPEGFAAVGQWYRDFSQTSDEEVRACLAAAPKGGAKNRC